MNKYTKITAHSGACGHVQNSAEYIDFAVASPYDAFEIDIRRVSGKLLLTHDEDANALPLSELFSRMADSGNPDISVNCDCKSAGITAEIIAAADEYTIPHGRLIFTGSVTDGELAQTVGSGAYVSRNLELFVNGGWSAFFAASPESADEIFMRAADICAKTGTGVNVNYRAMTENAFEIFASHGVAVMQWTVDDESAMCDFISRGVAWLTTNKPDTAYALRSQMCR